jgi:hypothetical protein
VGFELVAVADIVIGAGGTAVSDGARWLGRALADVDLASVAELWRELLDRRLDANAYVGFGWMAINGHLEEDAWLSLTQETRVRGGRDLDEPDRAAERATNRSWLRGRAHVSERTLC